jgi:hypothetical protein
MSKKQVHFQMKMSHNIVYMLNNLYILSMSYGNIMQGEEEPHAHLLGWKNRWPIKKKLAYRETWWVFNVNIFTFRIK